MNTFQKARCISGASDGEARTTSYAASRLLRRLRTSIPEGVISPLLV